MAQGQQGGGDERPKYVRPDDVLAAHVRTIRQLREALEMLLPLAEAFLSSAPSHPDNAKLEQARLAIAITKGIGE